MNAIEPNAQPYVPITMKKFVIHDSTGALVHVMMVPDTRVNVLIPANTPAGGGAVEIPLEQNYDAFTTRYNPATKQFSSWTPPGEYVRQRVAAYPPISDQLDALWKYLGALPGNNMPADVKAMVDSIQAVKTKYPKTA